MPAKTRSYLEEESLLFVAEKVRITIVYFRLKAPGRSFRNKREVVWGSLGVSNKRIVGYAFRKKIIHLPFEEKNIKSINFSVVDNKVLVIAFDPSIFNPKQSGSMEIRYHFEEARMAYNIIINNFRR